MFGRHAGAARWAFNWAHGQKLAAFEARRAEIAVLVARGYSRESAGMAATVRVPTKAVIQRRLNVIKGDSRVFTPPVGDHGPHRPCAWWHEVSTHALQSAMLDADRAWENWADSVAGRRAGPPVGAPRFKRKNRARDSFRLYGAALRPEGYRRLRLPRIGSVRLHESAKRLVRLLDRGDAVLRCVTVSRGGSRWYACVLAEVTQEVPDGPTRRQRAAGAVGVDLGVRASVTLSRHLDPADPGSDTVAHPRFLEADRGRLAGAQRRLARTVRGSRRQVKAARRVGAIHARVAERRLGHHHQVTKRLVTRFAVVGVENLDVRALAVSAAGTVEEPGTDVKVRARFNRFLLDAAPGELRRQLQYKARWYGSVAVLVDRASATNRICSSCRWENPPSRPGADRFVCERCDLRVGRAVNSARNIQQLACYDVASDRGETRNARGAHRPPGTRADGRWVPKREGPPRGSPRRSDPPATDS